MLAVYKRRVGWLVSSQPPQCPMRLELLAWLLMRLVLLLLATCLRVSPRVLLLDSNCSVDSGHRLWVQEVSDKHYLLATRS